MRRPRGFSSSSSSTPERSFSAAPLVGTIWWSSEGCTFLVELQAKQIDHSSHTSSHHQSTLVLPCVVALMITAVDLSCSSLKLTLKYQCNDFQVGCLCSISPQQRLGTAWETPPLRRRVPRWRLAPPHAARRQPLLTTRRSSQLQSLTELPRSRWQWTTFNSTT